MICFEFLRILEKNRKKGKPENLGKHGPLRRSMGCLTVMGPKGQKGPPRVRYDVALLRCSIAVLCRGVNTVH